MKTLLNKFFGGFVFGVDDITKPIAKVLAALEAHEQHASVQITKIEDRVAWYTSHADWIKGERDKAARIKERLAELLK